MCFSRETTRLVWASSHESRNKLHYAKTNIPMEIPIHATTWHGIDLLQFPAAKDAQDKPAGPEFYEQFYTELAKRPVDNATIAGKAAFGLVCIRQFLEPWEKLHGRKPTILSLGVGQGIIEEGWLQTGYTVTLQECQAHSLVNILAKYPHAKSAVGDASKMEFSERFDFIAIFMLDSCLSRQDLAELLRRAGTWLTPDGVILLQSAAVLSFRQIVAEWVKGLRRLIAPKPHVFWGWWRTVGDICRIAESSKLQVRGVYSFRAGAEGIFKRPRLMQRAIALKSKLIAIEIGQAQH
jgi:hypothetical protein